jgi:guanine deaminase
MLIVLWAYSEHQAERSVKKMKKDKIQATQGASTDSEFMTRALELSKLALHDNQGHPFGSVVVKDGKIIGEGWNKSLLFKNPSSHAEVEAIKAASKKLSTIDLSGATIYTSAQPCPMCLSLISLTGISKIYYCIPHSKIEEFNEDLSNKHISDDLKTFRSERIVPEVQILPEAADKYIDSYSSRVESDSDCITQMFRHGQQDKHDSIL